MNNSTNINLDRGYGFGDLLILLLGILVFIYLFKKIRELFKCKRRELNIYDEIESLDNISIISDEYTPDNQSLIQDSAMNINNESCSICLSKLKDKYVITNCNHKYHFICLKRWKSSSEEFLCPICRKQITNITHIQS